MAILQGLGVGRGGDDGGETLQGPARVIDGDTLEVQGVRIRLHGLDAPETRQLCTGPDGASYSCGAVATDALRAKIGGRSVECEGDERDRYRRLVATCRVDGDDLGPWLVGQGLAVAYYSYSWRYAVDEAGARIAGRGLWAGGFQRPADWRHAK